ncbi:hypothetical protein V492_01930 [Pseudogymnoascus sp. VKM F-4246]|nr:hypothetical protein V492_01930 [Pseudogymnoascus sp. VKM F-4246]
MDSSMGNGHSAPGIVRDPATIRGPDIPHVLPHEKVFPIQIGSKLFRLSGASISSDAPSYFSEYFKCQIAQAETRRENGEPDQGIKTLYIDRDPTIFSDISRHLQGYHIQPRDGSHFVKLFADAQFYQLPRLVSQLFEDSIYISIGGREFRVQKDLFTAPGDTPNYFTLGFAVMFSSTDAVFPGLDRAGLLRPPSIVPPAVPSRSGEVFAELIHMLKGYPLHIRNEAHRAELLRDCRYFLFKGLEQKLIPHSISHNLQRGKDEITIRLEDIRQPGLSIAFDAPFQTSPPPQTLTRHVRYSAPSMSGWVHYVRPFVDTTPCELIIEISGECTRLDVDAMRVEFSGDAKKRVNRLVEVLASKINVPNARPLGLLMGSGPGSQPESPASGTLGEGSVKVALEGSSSVVLDGKVWKESGEEEDEVVEVKTETVEGVNASAPPRKRRRVEDGAGIGVWTVRTGQWRVRVQPASSDGRAVECVLIAVKIDAFTGEIARNQERTFLSG